MQSLHRFAAAALLLALTSTLGQAQVRNSFQARSHTSPSVSMVYRLFVPKDYSATRQYPLLVALHGVGEKGNDNAIQVDREDLASTWIADSLQARVPHFVLVPQCPTNMSWGGAANDGIFAIIDSLKREFRLDTNRLYAVGLSMGARGTFNLLASRPGYFAAAVPCAGAGTNSQAAAIARTPLWTFHGDADPIVSVEGTRSMVAAIEGTGIRFVRFFSETWNAVPGLDTYSRAVRSGTNPIDMVARNPSGISFDSLGRAVAGGAKYLYSEVKGGDHRTGWMVAFHNPLVPGWIFSKVKGGGTVSIAPRIAARPVRAGSALVFGGPLKGEGGEGIYSLSGRRLMGPFPGSAQGGAHQPLLVSPAR